METKKISVILADDHPITRKGIADVLQSNAGIDLIGIASNGAEALAMVEKNNPDILLTDISMPELTGIEVTKKIDENKDLKTKVVILSMHNNEKFINSSFETGARGYVLKDAESDEIIEAIRQVYTGKIYCCKSVSQILVSEILNRNKEAIQTENSSTQITKREKEVINLIYEGLSNKQIGSQLFLSTRTVDAHRYNIMQKLNVKNTAELIKKAIGLKIIEV